MNFYSYQNPNKALTEGIKLERSNYYGEGTLAYIANIKGTTVTLKIGRNDNSYDTKTISLKEIEETEGN